MADSVMNSFRMDRKAFAVASLRDPPDDAAYWRSQSPQARLAAMELMRRINYGDAATGRLQRVLEIAQRQKS